MLSSILRQYRLWQQIMSNIWPYQFHYKVSICGENGQVSHPDLTHMFDEYSRDELTSTCGQQTWQVIGKPDSLQTALIWQQLIQSGWIHVRVGGGNSSLQPLPKEHTYTHYLL